MKIEDDFLGQKEFDEIQTLMMGSFFSWYYNDFIDYEDDENKFQFVYCFYEMHAPTSSVTELLSPIIKIINPYSIRKIKANLLTRTPKIVENKFHTDMTLLPEEQLKQWTTSIFYINTNNGYTKFKDGTKVESVANRMISFPANMKHTGTSCTDERTRVIINFNYFK